MRRREVLANLGLACAALLVAVLLAEAALRVLKFRPAILDRRMFVANPDTLLPYKLRAGYSGWYAGAWVTIDSAGQRRVRASVAAPAGADPRQTKTVLLLGDSQIFGHGLSDEQTTASQLQDSLYAGGLNVQVRTIGVSGYSSWNEYAALRDYLASHRVDAVVLIYVSNDPTFDNDKLGIGRGEFRIASNTPFHRFTRFTYRHVYTTYALSDAWRRLRARDEWLPVPEDSAVEHSMAALARIRQLCDSQGIRFGVGLLREPVGEAALRARYERKIGEALTRHQIEWFPVASHTTRLRGSAAMVAWNDPHPSARATSYIASDILGHLRSVPGAITDPQAAEPDPRSPSRHRRSVGGTR